GEIRVWALERGPGNGRSRRKQNNETRREGVRTRMERGRVRIDEARLVSREQVVRAGAPGRDREVDAERPAGAGARVILGRDHFHLERRTMRLIVGESRRSTLRSGTGRIGT